MKKIIAILVTLLCFVGCSTKSEIIETNENLNEKIVSYFDNYETNGWSGNSSGFIFNFFDDTEYGFGLLVNFNDAQAKEYEALEWGDEYENKIINIVEESDTYEIINYNKYLPKEGELDVYIGQTIGDMFDEGYEDCGYDLSGDPSTFFLDGPMYSVTVTTTEIVEEGDLSENLEKSLVISTIEFNGFSSYFFDSFLDE